MMVLGVEWGSSLCVLGAKLGSSESVFLSLFPIRKAVGRRKEGRRKNFACLAEHLLLLLLLLLFLSSSCRL